MGRFGNALLAGVGAAAASGADSMEREIKVQQQVAAEQRAANLQISMAERMQAAKEAMQQRVDERFQAILKRKQEEQIPLEIAPGDPAPQDVKDMTRSRTREEAIDAALEEASTTDGAAYRAGRGMLDSEIQDSRNDRKDKLAEKREAAREQIAREQIEQRDRESARRERNDERDYKAAMASVAAREKSGGGSGGRVPAEIQKIEYLRNKLGFSDAELKAYVTKSKGKSDGQLFMEFKKANKFADDDEIRAMVQSVRQMDAAPAAAPAASKSISTLPAGAKQIGTHKGKPVYQTPDGKKFIQG